MTSTLSETLRTNLQQVEARISSACAAAKRSRTSVQLVAVTKYVSPEVIAALIEAGSARPGEPPVLPMHLGESRPQQLVSRAAELPQNVHWHLIGHLQRNKVASVLPVASLIHSVDSARLLARIGEVSTSSPSGQPAESRARVLLEVNVSGEASKDGFTPELLLASLPELLAVKNVEVAGLMTMAPLDGNASAANTVFANLREFRDRLQTEVGTAWTLNELSMGMSGDFEAGIAQGATLIRIGSLLFEGIPK